MRRQSTKIHLGMSFWEHVSIYSACNSRGEGEIEKVFVLDAHGFIRQKEVFVERSLLRSWSLETGF